MIYRFCFISIFFIFFPSFLFASECNDILNDWVISLYEVHQNPDCGSIVNKTYKNIGDYCGLTAKTDAYLAGSQMLSKGDLCGLPLKDAGVYIKLISNSVTYFTCGTPPVQSSNVEQIYYFTTFCTTCDCEEKGCILRGFACANGDAVAIEYTTCSVDQVPNENGSICGNQEAAEKILSGEIDGQIFESGQCNCNTPLTEIMDLCEQIDDVKSTCFDCSVLDDDNDGVNNCDDRCLDSPAGSPVGELGCALGDEDGDGVPDERDLCPNTPEGKEVDSFGCEIPEPDGDQDDDGDGIPNGDDQCSDTPSGSIVDPNGCPIDNPQPEPDPSGGDQDNDNALLKNISDWLKKISGTASKQLSKLEQIFDDTESMDESLNNIEDSLTESEELSEDEIPETLDYSGLDAVYDDQLDFFQNNSGIQSFFSGAHITASGDCTFIMINPVDGSNITVSLCPYAPYFSAFGTLLLGLCTISTGLYIFKG